MNKTLVFILFVFLAIKSKGQTDLSCQESDWHRVMGKQLLDSSYNISDSIIIILYNTLPPISWWQSPNRPLKDYHSQRLVEIINTSNASIFFMKPDGQLMLGLQAKNQLGEWKDVEEYFQGICGNSFKKRYDDSLNKNEKWQTFIEMPTGSIKTQYRIKLQLVTPRYPNHRFYYSNELDGRIELCRFIKNH